ncbi:tyrosine-type recombinase/integrase [Spirosoma validum]|uniref:Phage integrase SAM-like domain-containing protein n=1 Tax=Spirosoma validum TaxID=2771355 RepID=A0A927B1G8_9BACT|nr:phage integrase SAM-like domain-containing protein [Spirosoma validum]MBD2753831.1 phage integrase SAM-like domain-containing protein [Spirosoma validum]
MTYNVELTDKPDKHGLHHVMIRLHVKEQKPARIQTEIQIEYRHWNEKKKWGKWIRSSHGYADKLNADIALAHKRIFDAVSLLLTADPTLTPKQAKERLENSSAERLRDYNATNLLDQTNSFTTNQAKEYNWQAFLSWAGENVTLGEMTPELIRSYARHLQKQGKKNQTVNDYVDDLREFYTLIQQKRGLSKREILAISPFTEWKNLKAVKPKKGRLHQAGIEKMEAGPFDLLTQAGKVRYGSMVDWSRWCWLACFYLAGMRIGDLLRSRYEWFETDAQGKPVRLRYQMQKNGRPISIPLSAKAQTHLSHVWRSGSPPVNYLLPLLDSSATYANYRTYEQIRAMPRVEAQKLKSRLSSVTAQLNMWLKVVVHDLGIEVIGGASLTNHTARHSFADKVRLAVKNGKVDAKGRPLTNFDAKELLGHRFMSTTEMYFGDMDQEMLDSAMDALGEE